MGFQLPAVLGFMAVLCAQTIQAASDSSPADSFLRTSDDVLNRPYASLFTSAIIARQDVSDVPSDDVALNPDGSVNITAWDTATDAACREVLGGLHQSTNPSGTCVCYNLPSLDREKGTFEADLRLFQVSDPRGSWVGVAPENVGVSVSFNGASAMAIKKEDLQGGGRVGNFAAMAKRQDNGRPQLMRAFYFMGQLDNKTTSKEMTMAALEELIMPILTLTATNATGATVRANVSVNEAVFLTGVFSRDIVQSDFAAAQANVDKLLKGLEEHTVPFVLPGVQLLIFPAGLLIVSLWLVVGLLTVGFGTYERWQYAEMYKRRQAVLGGPTRASPI